METKTCQNCKAAFPIEADDVSFYEKIKVPAPTFCPECRFRRRYIWRNERSLYRRACDLCKKDKIMMYSANAPFPVFCKECWWSDAWNAADYARDYDFEKPFFKQMHELMLAVPRPGTIQQGNNVNSDYSNRVTDMRNCYLVFASTSVENSLYSERINFSKECMDCLSAVQSEQCYECIDCTKCSRLFWSQDSQECASSYFLFNCRNCTDCFGCVNMRNKSHCIFNEQYSPEEYKKFMEEFFAGGRDAKNEMEKKLREFRLQFPQQYYTGRQNDIFSGNWIENSKNALNAFTCNECWNIKHCADLFKAKDSMDYTSWGNGSELMYECINVGINCRNVRFGHEIWNGTFDATYCMNCHGGANNLFGCIGMKNGSYMILNKQYSETEYTELCEKIISQMGTVPYFDAAGRKYGFGEFYPFELAPFCYNESISQDFFPVTPQEAAAMHYPWKEPEPKTHAATIMTADIPQTITTISDDYLKETLECKGAGDPQRKCTAAFRLTQDELTFYRRYNIPLPEYCFNCRYYARMDKRNPITLWPRSCMCVQENHGHATPCPNTFETSYAPERPETVYCEKCYQQEVV